MIRALALSSLFMLAPTLACAQQSTLRSVETRGTSALSFLNGMRFQPRLAGAIQNDIDHKTPEIARPSIINRLRLDQLGSGLLPTETLMHTDPLLGGSPEENQIELRRQARSISAPPRPVTGFEIPDSSVVYFEKTRQTMLQARPGVDIAHPANSPAGEASTGLPAAWMGMFQQTLPGLDGELTDCKIPFEMLNQKCPDESAGFRCEHYDSTQFSQVVVLTERGSVSCSGTYVGNGWVVSAAHCFLPNQSAAERLIAWNDLQVGGTPFINGDVLGAKLIALKFFNVPSQPDRLINQVFIHPRWDPKQGNAGATSLNDIALIKFQPTQAIQSAVQPAVLSSSSVGSTGQRVTTAGFGMTTTSILYRFGVTWPETKLISQSNRLVFDKPQLSTFCKGDSGGPAFSGLQRGCTSPYADKPLPRQLLGVVSFHAQTRTGAAANDPASCQGSLLSAFTDVTLEENHDWICRITAKGVGGC